MSYGSIVHAADVQDWLLLHDSLSTLSCEWPVSLPFHIPQTIGSCFQTSVLKSILVSIQSIQLSCIPQVCVHLHGLPCSQSCSKENISSLYLNRCILLSRRTTPYVAGEWNSKNYNTTALYWTNCMGLFSLRYTQCFIHPQFEVLSYLVTWVYYRLYYTDWLLYCTCAQSFPAVIMWGSADLRASPKVFTSLNKSGSFPIIMKWEIGCCRPYSLPTYQKIMWSVAIQVASSHLLSPFAFSCQMAVHRSHTLHLQSRLGKAPRYNKVMWGWCSWCSWSVKLIS